MRAQKEIVGRASCQLKRMLVVSGGGQAEVKGGIENMQRCASVAGWSCSRVLPSLDARVVGVGCNLVETHSRIILLKRQVWYPGSRRGCGFKRSRCSDTSYVARRTNGRGRVMGDGCTFDGFRRVPPYHVHYENEKIGVMKADWDAPKSEKSDFVIIARFCRPHAQSSPNFLLLRTIFVQLRNSSRIAFLPATYSKTSFLWAPLER